MVMGMLVVFALALAACTSGDTGRSMTPGVR